MKEFVKNIRNEKLEYYNYNMKNIFSVNFDFSS